MTEFSDKLKVEWATATKIIVPEKSILSMATILTRPLLTWKTLLEVRGFKLDGNEYAHCLFYLIPRISPPGENQDLHELGILKVVEIEPRTNCSDQFVRASLAELRQVHSLRILLLDKKKRVERQTIMPFTLTMMITIAGKEQLLEIPFYSIGIRDVVPEFFEIKPKLRNDLRYNSPKSDGKIPGVRFISLMQEDDIKPVRNYKYLGGESSSDLNDNSLYTCRGVDESCNIVGSDVCHLCKYGFIQAPGKYCSNGGEAFCAPADCGGKNQIACPRGYFYSSKQTGKECDQEDKNFICRPGLTPECLEKKFVRCL